MHLKITNGEITFPYSVGQLRRDNPNTSFPKRIPDEILEAYGVYPVTSEEPPTVDDRTQKLSRAAAPELIDSVWIIKWTVEEKTAEEIQQYDAAAAENVRRERNALLAASDWTQVADAPVDAAAWATYRQALRDITSHANFPFLADGDWPQIPG